MREEIDRWSYTFRAIDYTLSIEKEGNEYRANIIDSSNPNAPRHKYYAHCPSHYEVEQLIEQNQKY
jgi:hypothetical protein